MALIGTNRRFRQVDPSSCGLVGYEEHEFARAPWPSAHGRRHDARPREDAVRPISGVLESVPVQSTDMHGQGHRVVDEITAEKAQDGLPSRLLLRTERAL